MTTITRRDAALHLTGRIEALLNELNDVLGTWGAVVQHIRREQPDLEIGPTPELIVGTRMLSRPEVAKALGEKPLDTVPLVETFGFYDPDLQFAIQFGPRSGEAVTTFQPHSPAAGCAHKAWPSTCMYGVTTDEFFTS